MIERLIQSYIVEKTGMSTEIVDAGIIGKILQDRMKCLGFTSSVKYFEYFTQTDEEFSLVTDHLVIPETWFFRNRESFLFMGGFVKYQWLPENRGKRKLRILSVPCSTGEEPYSIAITLLDRGISRDLFDIDGIDISKYALSKARKAVYGPMSFRVKDLSFRDRYFEKMDEKQGERYSFSQELRSMVRFSRGNFFDEHNMSRFLPYDIVFFRNLMIYLTLQARRKALVILDRLLKKGGLLFVGHAERPLIKLSGYAWMDQPGVFACRKTRELSESIERTGNAGLYERQSSQVRIPGEKKDSSADLLFGEKDDRDGKNEEAEFPSENLESAQILVKEGRFREAELICKRVINQDVFQDEAHCLLGIISLNLHHLDDAERYFRRAIYLNPNHLIALSYLVKLMELQEKVTDVEILRRRMRRVMERKESLNGNGK